jgi:hypothetical protein
MFPVSKVRHENAAPSSACTRQLPALILDRHPVCISIFGYRTSWRVRSKPYLLIGLLVLISVVAELILVIVVFVFELALVEVFDILVLESFTGEPINGVGNELLLDVFTQLVIKLQALLNVR